MSVMEKQQRRAARARKRARREAIERRLRENEADPWLFVALVGGIMAVLLAIPGMRLFALGFFLFPCLPYGIMVLGAHFQRRRAYRCNACGETWALEEYGQTLSGGRLLECRSCGARKTAYVA